MRVAAVQFRARAGSKAASMRALRDLADEAAIGSDLVVLPELAATGYFFPDAASARQVAEPADGPTRAAFGEVAREHRCWLVVGLPECDGDVLFNSALVIDPSGALRFCYRKTLLYDLDTTWARPGDSGYACHDTDVGSFGVGICMDINDDRFTTWCAAATLDAIALPTAWIEEGDEVWRYWMARLVGVRGALVASDKWGNENAMRFAGCSAILRRGQVLAGAASTGDAIVRATV